MNFLPAKNFISVKMRNFLFHRQSYKCIFLIQSTSFHARPDLATKRGMLLEKMITDKDKRKHWHLNVMNDKAKCRNIFEKVHRPHRRRSVLNSVMIKNITDVISTGEIMPEVLGYGIEITGVNISPCCKILNVFWTIPAKHYESSTEIARCLGIAAPKIRAELISRNVLGRVPFIYFLRDSTNARIAGFEEALAKLESSADMKSNIVPDDSFVTDLYSFKKPRVKKVAAAVPEAEEKNKNLTPQCPPDMKSDVFGLDRDKMMAKVLAVKKSAKKSQQSAVITQEMIEKGDLFSKIPGICFEPDTSREKILKQFQIERKILKQKKLPTSVQDDDYKTPENYEDYYVVENDADQEDFWEETTKDS